jgi:DNA-binding NarL/FixJ family response regulator
MRTPTAIQPISVLIVDDHPLVRWGMRTFLATQPDITVVGEAASGQEALLLTEELVPDVALLDLVMPGMDGIEATRCLKQLSPRTQIIVLTSFHEDEHIFPAIRAGALSYLLKDIQTEELADVIRKAARGETVMHPHVAARLVQDMQDVSRASTISSLSEREQEVLRLIAEGQSNTIIAERLVFSEHTVKSHVSNILSKLHLADRTQAAVFAWREGIVVK